MSNTDGLVAWVNGTLDEVERVARWAAESARLGVRRDDTWVLIPSPDDLMVTIDGEERVMGFGKAAHIALNDPRAILARVEAERALLGLHHPTSNSPELRSSGEFWYCRACGDGGCCGHEEEWPCPTLRLLAYGHRFNAPGYDPAWAPEREAA